MSNKKLTICVVGLGNMGGAIFAVLKKNGYRVVSCEKKDDPNKILSKSDVIILAIKPQSFGSFAKNLEIDLGDKILISIMAGVKISRIKRDLAATKVIRTMPNLPLQVGASLTGWVSTKSLKAAEKSVVKKILNILGTEIELKNEKMINALTAVSGCGPAYYFLLTEMLEKAAIKYGFAKKDARKLAEATFVGAGKLFEEINLDAETLVKKVASKGGATEAALKHFRKKKLQGIVLAGVDKAKKRADELSK